MKMRSQLTNPNIVVDRNINSTDMDRIKAILSNLDSIQTISTDEVLAQIAEVAGLDFTDILASADIVDNLTVQVVGTLPAWSDAEAELVGNVIQLKIPAGADGLTPEFVFAYNETTGDIDYTVTYTGGI